MKEIKDTNNFYNPKSEIKNHKVYDLVFLIDNTGSMSNVISISKEHCQDIMTYISATYASLDINFGFVFYDDPVDDPESQHKSFQLCKNLNDLKTKINSIKISDGGDLAEDWKGGYEEALSLNWREGKKLIIQITDAPAHGKEFSSNIKDNYKDLGEIFYPIIKNVAKKNIDIVGLALSKPAMPSFSKFDNIYYEERRKHIKYFSIKAEEVYSHVIDEMKNYIIE